MPDTAEAACMRGTDFLTGVYHWSVDNYGSGQTPLVGSQIAAFQGHHQRPWTITEREFCNNVHKVLTPLPAWVLPPSACGCAPSCPAVPWVPAVSALCVLSTVCHVKEGCEWSCL